MHYCTHVLCKLHHTYMRMTSCYTKHLATQSCANGSKPDGSTLTAAQLCLVALASNAGQPKVVTISVWCLPLMLCGYRHEAIKNEVGVKYTGCEAYWLRSILVAKHIVLL